MPSPLTPHGPAASPTKEAVPGDTARMVARIAGVAAERLELEPAAGGRRRAGAIIASKRR
jgi:hypothetical protein